LFRAFDRAGALVHAGAAGPSGMQENRMRLLATAALLATLIAAPAFAGDPIGRYDVTGKDPGGGSEYTGTVVVEKTGDTYKVTWNIAGERFVGTAIGDTDGMAVTYKSKDQSGLALYGAKGDDWQGVWTYTGGRQIGVEAWTRK
jgi:hypothetical protein